MNISNWMFYENINITNLSSETLSNINYINKYIDEN